MKNKYKILILSNMEGNALKDDTMVRDIFEKDGHIAHLAKVDYDEALDEKYDVIIRRNTWVHSEADTAEYHIINQKLINRLTEKDIKTVNLVGLDGGGKGYLCEMYKNSNDVIPTVNRYSELKLLLDAEKYVIKDILSFGSGLHQKTVSKQNLIDEYKEGDIIQPYITFKSEIQCYFVGNKLMYVFEYIPSKHPHYPEPKLIQLPSHERSLSEKYATFSGLTHGFQRIDFLRLPDNSLLLLEIEDNSPFMNLIRLPVELRQRVLTEFGANIYDLLDA